MTPPRFSCDERRLLILTCIAVLMVSLSAAVEDQYNCRRTNQGNCNQAVTAATAAALAWVTGVLTKHPE